LIVTDPKVDR